MRDRRNQEWRLHAITFHTKGQRAGGDPAVRRRLSNVERHVGTTQLDVDRNDRVVDLRNDRLVVHGKHQPEPLEHDRI